MQGKTEIHSSLPALDELAKTSAQLGGLRLVFESNYDLCAFSLRGEPKEWEKEVPLILALVSEGVDILELRAHSTHVFAVVQKLSREKVGLKATQQETADLKVPEIRRRGKHAHEMPRYLRQLFTLIGLTVMVGSCNGLMGFLANNHEIRIRVQEEYREKEREKELAIQEKRAETEEKERNLWVKSLPLSLQSKIEIFEMCSSAEGNLKSRFFDKWMAFCLSYKPQQSSALLSK
ncbi:MAG: hypothetical protein ACKO45_05510 [Cyanobium sp.]